jgi:hypothetical protein
MDHHIVKTLWGPRRRALKSGRWESGPPGPEPPAPFLGALRDIARMAGRNVHNCPRCEAHIERMTLHWLMHWDEEQPVRRYIALRAANEARRVRALDEAGRTEMFGRSHSKMKLWRRSHRSERTDQREVREDVT